MSIRVFLDSDAVVSENAMSELATTLAPGTGIHFAAPRLALARSSSLATRSFFRIWQALPYVRDSPVTCGIYAVSAEGRRRWSTLPALHSDDKLVRLHFRPEERLVVSSATYTVDPPYGLRALVSARRRYLAGNRELSAMFPDLTVEDLDRYRGVITTVLRRPQLWPSGTVFGAIYLAAFVLDKWQLAVVPGGVEDSTSFVSPNIRQVGSAAVTESPPPLRAL